MTPDLARRVASLHGIAAWLATASLLACGFFMLRREKPAPRFLLHLSALSTSLVAFAFASGAALDLPWRAHLRQRLFLASRALGWLFERKLHFSWGALAFACVALLALVASRARAGDPSPPELLRVARLGFVASALCALFACVAGALASQRVHF